MAQIIPQQYGLIDGSTFLIKCLWWKQYNNDNYFDHIATAHQNWCFSFTFR